jgi:hypothetical protein
VSKPGDDFAASFVGIILVAAAFSVVLLALFLTPVFALAGVPVLAYLYHRNSPATKEKEARDRTEELYRKALALVPPDVEAHIDRMSGALAEPALSAAMEIYHLEGVEPPPPVPPICDSIEGARYRDQLIRYINTVHDGKRTDGFVDALIDCLPSYAEDGEGIFLTTQALSNEEIHGLIAPFYRHDDYFRALKRQLDKNLQEQKGVFPEDYKGDNCAFAYLKATPLLALEKRSMRVGLKARTEHTQVVAGSGSGKTSLLQYLIHHDITPPGDCCVIVIDSQRQLIDTLAHQSFWTGDLAYFSPRHNLGINLFDMQASGEQETNAVVDLLEYVLSSLMDAKLTSKQATLFNYAIQLMMQAKGNLSTLRQLLRKDGGALSFVSHIEKLPRAAQDFFLNEFAQKGYDSTREEIMWRIDAMQRNPAFARIFDAPKNPVDMADEMANRDLILIDTDVHFLGETASSFFGRLFIAFVLKAARERVANGGKHRPVYVYIDECAAYLDGRLETMLVQVRKANIGITLVHQDLDQLRKAGILNTVLGGTATKFAGRLSDTDARTMAANMRTNHDFLQSLPRYHFALSRIGEPTCAVGFDTWTFEKVEKRRDYKEMVAEMERRYGYAPKKEEPAMPPPAPEPPPSPPKKAKPAPNAGTRPSGEDEIRPSGKL